MFGETEVAEKEAFRVCKRLPVARILLETSHNILTMKYEFYGR
jgi:hypothetical protein